MHAVPLLLILLAALAGCGTEQSQPAPAVPAESWGKLGPDPTGPSAAPTDPADSPLFGPPEYPTKQGSA